jgi:transposase
METESLLLRHERIDDIPLLLGFLQKLGLPELLERHLGSHPLHKGLANGVLATTWIAFILSESDHRKVSVQDWARRHQQLLERFWDQPVRPVEFSDDRLSIVLRRLHEADWTVLETDLWQDTCQVYEIPLDCIRLDATTSYGYHQTTPEGVMQFGHSKDHRPDLPQLKLMAAVAQPTSQLVACDVVAGNSADDPLYLPLIRRVRQQLDRHGLLYAGDCKMAALETRAELAANRDFYLMPLPRTGDVAAQWDTWIEQALAKPEQLKSLSRLDADDNPEVFARGYEWKRDLTATVADKLRTWTERVQVVQPLGLAQRQGEQLEQRLQRAEAELRGLTPPVKAGHRQHREEATLQAAVAEVLRTRQVEGLLHVNWEAEVTVQEKYQGRGRGGPQRPKVKVEKVRYVIATIRRDETAIARQKERLGWRVQVTNLTQKRCGLTEAVLIYNEGWSVERDFHVLKDRPLGIQPLFVREEEQIVGLTRLLTIALRVLTLIELVIRSQLEEREEELSGLYEGQAKRTTGKPTAVRLLKAIARLEITLSCVEGSAGRRWQLTPLPPLLKRVLSLLGVSSKVYLRLTHNTG